jgi:glycosyltransferase involved in cell wall biosynthesis
MTVRVTDRVEVRSLPTVTVILPAFNEESIIVATLEAVHAELFARRKEFLGEIIVVNDGSSDATGRLANTFAATHSNVRVLHHRVNFNLGQSLRFAFAQARTDYVVTLDSDLSYSVDHIRRLVQAIHTTAAKVVLASPYTRGGEVSNVPLVRRVLSRWANRYLSLAVHGEISTLTGMVRAFDRAFLQSLDLTSRDTSINAEIVYKARILGARIVEIPAHLDWGSAPGRISKAKLASSVRTYALSGFLFRPLFSLAIPGFFFLLGGVAAFVFGARDALLWRRSLGDVLAASPATFIVAALCLVMALQWFSLGLLAWQSKRNFDHLFHLGTANLRWSRSLSDGAGFVPGTVAERRCRERTRHGSRSERRTIVARRR